MRIAAMVVAAVAFVAAAGALWIGGHAGPIKPTPYSAPDVVGMRLADATARLRQAGNVRIDVQRVSWAPRGRVAQINGVGFDGYYTRDSVLVLRVGR
jgi:hypothetical protein